MKMNKILAAGVAASLAVTSLAAVASAAERTFDMKYTTGTVVYKASANKTIGVSLDDQFGYKKLDDQGQPVPGTGSYTPTTIAKADYDVNKDGEKDFRDFDAFIPVKVSGNAELVKMVGDGSKIQVVISGRKEDNGNLVSIKQTATLMRADYKALNTAESANYILPIYYEVAPAGCFLANDFVAVDSIEVLTGTLDDIKKEGLGQKSYETITGEGEGKYFLTDADTAKTKTAWTTSKTADKAELKIAMPTDGITALQLDGGTNYTTAKVNDVLTITEVTKSAKAEKLFQKVAELIGTKGIVFTWSNADKSTTDNEAWLPITTNNTIMVRNDIKKLSVTGAHGSTSWDGIDDGATQSYEEKEYNKGDQPHGFAGLASQVADFFNKQLNGTITFHFAAGKTEENNSWLNGGIPSTEVGIRNALGEGTKNDFALFVNYASTTGSLQAVTEVKAEELSVTFDISDILDALGGQTIGTVQDIYYGMNKGVNYGDGWVGFKVDTVTLAYDEDASDEDIVDGDEDEGDEGDVDVDVDGDEDEGDEGDVDVDGDEDEGDGDVDGDTDEDDFPTDGDEAGEDENPGTGVALAVVPAIMAAAAVVVSKKRK